MVCQGSYTNRLMMHFHSVFFNAQKRGLSCLKQGLAALLLTSVSVLSAASESATDAQAHWLSPQWLLAPHSDNALSLNVSNLPETTLVKSVSLTKRAMPDWLRNNFPHLAHLSAYQVALSPEQAKQWSLGKLALVDSKNGQVLHTVQFPWLLDALYTANANDANEYNGFGSRIIKDDSGPSVQFSIWAPTAHAVSVKVYDKPSENAASAAFPMQLNPKTGVWQASEKLKVGTWYRYQITGYSPSADKVRSLEVTDPYSLSLSTNSRFSQVVDLSSPDSQPEGWTAHATPKVEKPEDLILYESHIRDFSAVARSVKPQWRGKYRAFLQTDSVPVAHLRKLRQAGVNVVHLLPTYDITTVDERAGAPLSMQIDLPAFCQRTSIDALCTPANVSASTGQTVFEFLSSLPGDNTLSQQVITRIREQDAYNWGYDPFHYTVPEGSYATEPDGKARIIEFREMVQVLHQMGFRVIMDVVYNHTFAAGDQPKSVLDRVVPGYYHRRNIQTGQVEQSTCCENTATERAMMEKLMRDSLVVWARDYRIDGFRFDLMGHQPKDAMLRVREAVRAVDPDTYFYGEGWNFGEVANHQRFEQASQLALAGTEIGTFTDRLRDAVRGGSSFVSGEDLRKGQGIGSGLMTQPNELNHPMSEDMRKEWQLSLDQIRVGLAGNLADFEWVTANADIKRGDTIPYGDSPTGYAKDPADTINYVSKHDNQTLWDNHQYRIAFDATLEQRARMHSLSLGYALFAQGIPFIHMGSEIIRSKAFLRDSYDYGDLFNAVDFSMQETRYQVGLPPAEKDRANWAIIRTIKAKNEGRDVPTQNVRQQHLDQILTMLSIRTQSPLFRLATAEQIINQLSFLSPEHPAGVITMQLEDLDNIDSNVSRIVVMFNPDLAAQHVPLPGRGLVLHPLQQDGKDEVIKATRITDESVTVPGLSIAVLVQPDP